MNNEHLQALLSNSDMTLPQKYTFGSGDPEILITAGIHGDEPTSINVAYDLIEFMESSTLDGKITIVPVANQAAFISRSRTAVDDKDLNRVFPGKATGTHTERIANNIWEIAKKCDFVLDLHCCGPHSSPYLLALHKENDFIKEFANYFPLETCIQSSGQEGQLFVEATRLEIPSLIIEIPGGGKTSEIPVNHKNKIFNVVLSALRSTGIVDDSTAIDKTKPVFAGQLDEISSPINGIFTPSVSPGTNLEEDESIGSINEIEISTPTTGRLIFSSPVKFVFMGETVGRYVPY